MVYDFNFLKLRSLDSLWLVIYPVICKIRFKAYTLRFESLASSDRLGAFWKITTAVEHCQDIKLGPNARAS